jgi:cytochrome c5
MPVRLAVILSLLVAAVLALHGCPKPTPQEPSQNASAIGPGTPGETPEPVANEEAAPANEAEDSEAAPETSANAKALFETKCSKCHKLEKATSEPGDKAHWDELVKEMQAKKAGWISDAEAAQIAGHCAGQYPK